jgi:hypothetical protein
LGAVSSNTNSRGKHGWLGKALIERLASDLTARLEQGFSETNLKQMRDYHAATRTSAGARVGKRQIVSNSLWPFTLP